jgi:hypothetical protein
MKRFRSLSTILLALILTLISSQIVFAQGPLPPERESFQKVIQEYGLTSVPDNEVPPDVIPLQFDDPENLELFLTNLNSATAEIQNFDFIESATSPALYSPDTARSTYYVVVTRKCSTSLGYGIAKFNTWADIKVGVSGSFRWISSVLKPEWD